MNDPNDNRVSEGRRSETAGQMYSIYPQTFGVSPSAGAAPYLADRAARSLADFFHAKGLAALKEEDRREEWHADWLTYQARHHLYASVLSPKSLSHLGAEFDPLRYARFLELFAYFSPAHGYSLQVSSLALFSILLGSNDALKKEAVQALEAGRLLAFGISEREHGSDLLSNEFTVGEDGAGRLVAAGSKYYIGNANVAAVISILGRWDDSRRGAGPRRAAPVLLAIRPEQARSFQPPRKIRTLGVRSAFVGEFTVVGHELPQSDIIAEGRGAWDAVIGAVTLGKFFLGFGSIGICEHALEEATQHTSRRVLYGRAVIDMPHIRLAIAQAYARLLAMKLFAYRALDYLQSASAEDRRYLLFNAVQKARVSTEGVKVMTLLSECMGARGFEADTYFEMALRDAQLIPGLEGSTHINLGFTVQFIPRYFGRPSRALAAPGSLIGGGQGRGENEYLMKARSGAVNTISFPPLLRAYGPLRAVRNVRLFVQQARAFKRFVRSAAAEPALSPGSAAALLVGRSLATIAYAQLVAENAVRLDVPAPMVSVIFHLLVSDLSATTLDLAGSSDINDDARALLRPMVLTPRTPATDWDSVS